jgi:hypothetical protein
MKRYFCFFVLLISGMLYRPVWAGTQNPFFVFAAGWDSAAVEVVLRSFGKADLLGDSLLRGSSVQSSERPLGFALPPSLALVAKAAAQPCTSATRSKVVIYNPEHWDATPPQELNGLHNSIADAARMVRASGCRIFGVAPDGKLLGLPTGQCRGEPSALATQVDWKQVDLVLLQAQRLLADRCGGAIGVQEYARFVGKWSRELKAANPSIKVVAQLSFRYTDVETMLNAIDATRTVADGYYLAYPNEKSGVKCQYCAPENLERLLARFR